MVPPLKLSLNDTMIITKLSKEFKMKVYGLIGKSGTGKSFQAVNLCKQLNIESIIDDGLHMQEQGHCRYIGKAAEDQGGRSKIRTVL